MAANVDPIEGLVRVAAADIKKRGWRGVMRSMGPEGKVVITNHNQPEAVIVSAKEYARLMSLVARTESDAGAALEALRKRFDERLASLQEPDAGDKLRSIMNSPARLDGKLGAGSSH